MSFVKPKREKQFLWVQGGNDIFFDSPPYVDNN